MNRPLSGVRRQNFSPHEVETFLRITKKYKSTIDCKEINGISNRLKRATWTAIKNEFNSVPNFTKSNEYQLQTLYRNLKKKFAKAKAEGKMQTINTNSELNESDENQKDMPERTVSMSSVILSLKDLYDTNEDPQRLTDNTVCSLDNYSPNSTVENDKVSETNCDEVVSLQDVPLLHSLEVAANTSSAKSKRTSTPYILNFEGNYNRKKTRRKKSTDESSSDAALPSSSKQPVTCSVPSVSCVSDDMTRPRQVMGEAYTKDSPDSAFCHYIHTMLANVPDSFEKEMAKIQMTEIIMKLKYPQG